MQRDQEAIPDLSRNKVSGAGVLEYSYSGRTAQAVKVLAAGRTVRIVSLTPTVSLAKMNRCFASRRSSKRYMRILSPGKTMLASVDDHPTESERSTSRESQAEGMEIRTLAPLG